MIKKPIFNKSQKLYFLTMSTYILLTLVIDLFSFGHYLYALSFMVLIIILCCFKKIREYTINYKNFILLSVVWFFVRYITNHLDLELPVIVDERKFVFYIIGFVGLAGYYHMAKFILNDKKSMQNQ